jgi:hypothetical protein
MDNLIGMEERTRNPGGQFVDRAQRRIAALDGGWRSAPGLSQGDRNGPKYVSAPIALPDGYLLMVHFGGTPAELVRTVPDLIARRLDEADVGDATIGAAARMGDRHATVTGFAPAARAWLCGPRAVRSVRRRGSRQAGCSTWRSAGSPATTRPGRRRSALVVSAELPLEWPTLTASLQPALNTQTPVVAVASDFATAATAIAVEGGLLDTAPAASLGSAGDRDLAADLASMRDLVVENAHDLVWAGAGMAVDARDAYAASTGLSEVADVLVPDGMWFQLLSEGHLDRLGGPPEGAHPIGGGRVELTVGEPEQWLPGHPDRVAVVQRARTLLAGCIADPDEVLARRRKRLRAARANDVEGLFPGPLR